MRISDKALLSMIQKGITHEVQKDNNSSIGKIFCKLNSNLIELEFCKSCQNKCSNYLYRIEHFKV